MPPNISIRKYIRYLPDAAKEPTNTVVLTSGQNRFVDIRTLKPSESSSNSAQNGDVLHSSRLDWAFAGTSSSILHDNPDGSTTVHTTWKHWIDSQARDAESVSDEGDMIPQPDGTTLEKGHNIDPDTGARTDYEELWEDLQPTTTEDDTKKVCAVLQLHDDKNEARGMVVRLGQFCQGLLRVGDHISLERWEWKAEGGWKRQARIGSLWLPCGVLLEGQKLKLGGEVQYEDYLWKVVELEEF